MLFVDIAVDNADDITSLHNESIKIIEGWCIQSVIVIHVLSHDGGKVCSLGEVAHKNKIP